MKHFVTLCALLLCATATFAQTFYKEEPMLIRPSRTVYQNQIGLVGDMMVPLAHNGGPRISFLKMEYAHYGWNNWGIRAGLKMSPERDNTVALPLHLSWRAAPQTARNGRDRRAYYVFPYERPRPDGDTHRYYYDEYYSLHNKGVGGAISDLAVQALTSSSPVTFDLHAGLTPAYIFHDTWQTDFQQGDYAINQRFMCTIDAGARAMFQFWKFGFVLDATYQFLVTDNFRYEGKKCSRHYMNLGVGLVYRF